MISMRVNEVFQYLTATDEELLKKCHQCMEIIVSAKDRQAAEANRHASILLEQLDREKSQEESKKAAAARKREKKRRKKKEKQEQAQKDMGKEPDSNSQPKNSSKQKSESKTSTPEPCNDKKDDEDDEEENEEDDKDDLVMLPPSASSSSTTGLPLLTESNKTLRHKRSRNNEISSNSSSSSESNGKTKTKKSRKAERERERLQEQEKENEQIRQQQREEDQRVPDMRVPATPNTATAAPSYHLPNSTSCPSSSSSLHLARKKRPEIPTNTERHGIGDLDDFGLPSNIKPSSKEKERNRKNMDKSSKVSSLDTFGILSPGKSQPKPSSAPSPKKNPKKEEGWKEVTRKTCSTKSKRVTVPSNAISRVIGRGGSNINAIREASGAHIDVDKQKGSGDRFITIKGSTEATRQAHTLISALIKDPDKDLDEILPKRQKSLLVSQNNNNNISFFPSSSATTAHLFSASVWHNSMANHLTSAPSILPLTSMPMPLQPGKGPSTKVTTIGTTRLSTSATSPAIAQLQAPFANVVRQSQSPGAVRPPLMPPGVLNEVPMSVASIQRAPGSAPGIITGPPPKSPGSVARQLFPGSEKTAPVSSVKTSVTYSTVSMAKTKVVTSSTPTFASKVDHTSHSRPMLNMNNKGLQQQKSGGSGSPAPSSKSNVMTLSSSKSSSEPQPLPIKSTNSRLMSPHQGSNSRPAAPPGPTEYSPFNNRFSHELEMLNKKEEADRKDFASVAAAGVVPASSSVMSSVSPAPIIDSQPDPSLPAKAPGYKHPNQRTSSPQINEHDARSKNPGYVGLSQPHPGIHPHHPHHPLTNQQVLDHLAMENLVAGAQSFPHIHGGNHQSNMGEADPSKAPGFKGFSDFQDSMSRTPGYRHHMSSHHNMSNRPNMMGPHGGFSSLLQSHPRNEYSTPDQPMTLPKIESTLNPNAPDFTSRAYETSGRFPLGPGMGPGFGSSLNSLSNFAALAGLSGLQSSLGPALGLGNQGFRVPPPPVGSVLSHSQPNMAGMMQGGEFMPPNLSSSDGQVFTRFAQATLLNSGAMNLPPNVSSRSSYKPMPPAGPSSATTPPVGAAKRESPVSTVASEPSPSSSSAPSPTDQSGGGVDNYSRGLRPIGTERAYKKPPHAAPGFPSMAEAGAAGLWAYSSDLSADWMSAVMPTSVVTSSTGVMGPGSAENEEQRPASHPSMSPRMMPPTNYPPPPDPSLSHLDPASLEAQFGQAAVLMASNGGVVGNGGPAVITSNGIPPGAAGAALPPHMPPPHMYNTQPPTIPDNIPSMWTHPNPSHDHASKMSRAHFTN